MSDSPPPSTPPRSSFSMPGPVLRWGRASSTLSEALNTPLPRKPARARLPPAFHISYPPPFGDNLTRSTLPTASLSPPLPVQSAPYSRTDPIRPPPIVLLQSHPSRTSLDSLRSVTRSFSTSSASTPSFVPSPETERPASTVSSKWWFDSLLPIDDRPPPKEVLKQNYLSTKNPVVFCHGLLGFDSVTIGPAIAPFEVAHWRGIKEVLEENGTEVLITRVPATSSPVDRAKVLEEKISSVYPGQSVHLIGHSMGGLDCRYLATHLTKRKFNVLSITTIATPHRGSSFADHFLSTVGRTRMPSVLSLLDLLPNGGGDGKAFECLTVESMRKFNEDTPDVPGVRYFSWGAVYDPGLIDTWKWPHSVILEKEGPNDGLVSVESSKWGTYLGTLSQVNHLDLVGWVNTARYKWAEIMGKEIKFRPATFYLGIVDMLAREVEGQGKDKITCADADANGKESKPEEQEQVTSRSSGVSRLGRESLERAQMVDSLDKSGADVHPSSSSSSSPSQSNAGTRSSTPTLRKRNPTTTTNTSTKLRPP